MASQKHPSSNGDIRTDKVASIREAIANGTRLREALTSSRQIARLVGLTPTSDKPIIQTKKRRVKTPDAFCFLASHSSEKCSLALVLGGEKFFAVLDGRLDRSAHLFQFADDLAILFEELKCLDHSVDFINTSTQRKIVSNLITRQTPFLSIKNSPRSATALPSRTS